MAADGKIKFTRRNQTWRARQKLGEFSRLGVGTHELKSTQALGAARTVIRQARIGDVHGLCRTQIAAIRGGASRYYTREQIRAWLDHVTPAAYEAALASGKEIYMVVTQEPPLERRVLGFGYSDQDEIQAVYVDPKYSGLGIARRILRFLERRLKGKGYHEVRLNASFAAECFYIRMGYESMRTLWVPTHSGVKLPARQMKKG
jgi:putative acetyltransferase